LTDHDVVPLDSGREQGHLVIARYDADQVAYWTARLGHEPTAQELSELGEAPYEEVETGSNLITTAGWTRLLTLAIGGGGTAFTATTTRIGVGIGTTAATVADTDLAAATGSTTRRWELVTGAGTVGAGTLTRRLSFAASWASGDGNFAWNEVAIDQGTASGTGAATATLLNRVVGTFGTKTTGQVWGGVFNLEFS
jgi:hypothetical protein